MSNLYTPSLDEASKWVINPGGCKKNQSKKNSLCNSYLQQAEFLLDFLLQNVPHEIFYLLKFCWQPNTRNFTSLFASECRSIIFQGFCIATRFAALWASQAMLILGSFQNVNRALKRIICHCEEQKKSSLSNNKSNFCFSIGFILCRILDRDRLLTKHFQIFIF